MMPLSPIHDNPITSRQPPLLSPPYANINQIHTYAITHPTSPNISRCTKIYIPTTPTTKHPIPSRIDMDSSLARYPSHSQYNPPPPSHIIDTSRTNNIIDVHPLTHHTDTSPTSHINDNQVLQYQPSDIVPSHDIINKTHSHANTHPTSPPPSCNAKQSAQPTPH